MMEYREILGVAADADTDAIRRAYAIRLRNCRPDRHPQAFRILREAYEQLLKTTTGQGYVALPPLNSRLNEESPSFEQVDLEPGSSAPLELTNHAEGWNGCIDDRMLSTRIEADLRSHRLTSLDQRSDYGRELREWLGQQSRVFPDSMALARQRLSWQADATEQSRELARFLDHYEKRCLWQRFWVAPEAADSPFPMIAQWRRLRQPKANPVDQLLFGLRKRAQVCAELKRLRALADARLQAFPEDDSGWLQQLRMMETWSTQVSREALTGFAIGFLMLFSSGGSGLLAILMLPLSIILQIWCLYCLARDYARPRLSKMCSSIFKRVIHHEQEPG